MTERSSAWLTSAVIAFVLYCCVCTLYTSGKERTLEQSNARLRNTIKAQVARIGRLQHRLQERRKPIDLIVEFPYIVEAYDKGIRIIPIEIDGRFPDGK